MTNVMTNLTSSLQILLRFICVHSFKCLYNTALLVTVPTMRKLVHNYYPNKTHLATNTIQ